jgi:hypothetical protein
LKTITDRDEFTDRTNNKEEFTDRTFQSLSPTKDNDEDNKSSEGKSPEVEAIDQDNTLMIIDIDWSILKQIEILVDKFS